MTTPDPAPVRRRRRVKPWRCGYSCDCLIDPAALPNLSTISYGGGVQSTALLVLAARGVIDFRTFLFCNVGDDSEHPGTLEYVEHIAKPYAAFHGIDLQELARVKRDGTSETLWGRLMREDSRSLPIPVRMSNGAPGNRSCTADFKIRVVSRWLKAHGAHGADPCPVHAPAQDAARAAAKEAKHPVPPYEAAAGCGDCVAHHRATVGIGISLDEIQRANTRVKDEWERVVYPLIGIGLDTGLSLRRDDCMTITRTEPLPEPLQVSLRAAVDAGLVGDPGVVRQLRGSDFTLLPVPPKSSCFFCPFHRPGAWSDLERETPELFAKACQLEDTLNDRRRILGKDEVFLTRFAIPLRDAIDTDQPVLSGFDDLDDADGVCGGAASCWT